MNESIAVETANDKTVKPDPEKKAAALSGIEQTRLVRDGIDHLVLHAQRMGVEPDNVLTALLAYTSNALLTFGNDSDRRLTEYWLRDIAAMIAARNKAN